MFRLPQGHECASRVTEQAAPYHREGYGKGLSNGRLNKSVEFCPIDTAQYQANQIMPDGVLFRVSRRWSQTNIHLHREFGDRGRNKVAGHEKALANWNY